jgi:hypothetical protein
MSDMMNRLAGARSNLAFKTPCGLATTANITLNGFQTIDGVTYDADDAEDGKNMRVLVKNQTDQTTNGIYVMQTGDWERSKDFDGNTDALQGTMIYVALGSANGGTFFSVTTADPIEIGDDNITFQAETFNTGDVTGPGSSTDGNIVGWSGTGGDTLQDLGTFLSLLAGEQWTTTNIASATTTNIGGANTTMVIGITDANTITSFGSGINKFRILVFTGSAVLTHSSALVLPGAANITAASGDVALFRSNSTGDWRCLTYLRTAGRPLNTGVTDTLAVGYTATSFSAGTKTTGTFTPDPINGNFQHYTNGGAHTLAPPSSVCTIVMEVTNNGSAGAITTSGFTFASGDALTTTNGHKFHLYITKSQSYSLLQRKALQ